MSARSVSSTLAMAALVVLAPAAGFASSIVFTFPAAAKTGVQAVTDINSEVIATPATQSISLVNNGTATSASVSGVTGSASASVDLATGQLKASATSTHGFFSSATAWEFLTFDGNGQVSFAFDVDGSLVNTGGLVEVTAATRVYDVTDWTSYFGSTAGTQFAAKDGTGSPFPSIVGSAFDQQGVASNLALCTSQFIANCTIDAAGTVVPVDLGLSGSFNAGVGQLYLVEMMLETSTFNSTLGPHAQTGDFGHTATFSFTNLNGLNVQSASGTFLSQQVAQQPVPEPASMLLLGSGLAAAWAVRRRSRTRTKAQEV